MRLAKPNLFHEKQCEEHFSDSRNVDVRTSRFFMPGKGFKYRVVVEGIDTLDEAATIKRSLEVVPLDFVIVVDGRMR